MNLSEKVIVMGVLNLTPDSFSDQGKFQSLEKSQARLIELIQDGADIIDVGGESTAPGSMPINPEEEISRIVPLLEAINTSNIANSNIKTVLSIDTYKSKVAKKCLELGASIINDISGLRADPEMASIVAQYRAKIVIMFSKQGKLFPHADEDSKTYPSIEYLLQEITNFFQRQIEYAVSEGIEKSQIILDPGLGKFVSHDPKYSWGILRELEVLVKSFADFPILVGPSRKSFIGGSVEERDPSSQLISLFAIKKGAKIIRTHNPKMLKSFLICNDLLNSH